MEELKQFMEVAKLQNPTTKRRKQTKEEGTSDDKTETVKHEDDGTITIMRMEIQPSSKDSGVGRRTGKGSPPILQPSRGFQSE